MNLVFLALSPPEVHVLPSTFDDDLEAAYTSSEHSDVTFINNYDVIQAHSIMLAVGSTVWRNVLLKDDSVRVCSDSYSFNTIQRCAIIPAMFHHTSDVPSYQRCTIIPAMCHHTSDVPSYQRCAIIPAMFHHTSDVPSYQRCSIIPAMFHHTSDVPSYQRCAIIPAMFHYASSAAPRHNHCIIVVPIVTRNVPFQHTNFF